MVHFDSTSCENNDYLAEKLKEKSPERIHILRFWKNFIDNNEQLNNRPIHFRNNYLDRCRREKVIG